MYMHVHIREQRNGGKTPKPKTNPNQNTPIWTTSSIFLPTLMLTGQRLSGVVEVLERNEKKKEKHKPKKQMLSHNKRVAKKMVPSP